MRIVRVSLGLLIAVPVSLYVLYGAALWALQDTLIFPVMPASVASLDAAAQRAGIQVHHPQTADGTPLYAWHAPGEGERLLIFFHGNGGGVGGGLWFAEQLEGWDVVSFSYRGYPGSPGEPSEANMVEDARAIWRFVTEDLGFAPEQIVVHGQSMGGGVANHLLTEVEPAGLVLDSTFMSVQELAAGQAPLLPVSWLLRHPFRSDLRAPEIELPVLILHGDGDTLIPVSHGRRLAELYPNATYVEVAGGGHDMWLLDDREAYRVWRDFLDMQVD